MPLLTAAATFLFATLFVLAVYPLLRRDMAGAVARDERRQS